MNKYFNLSVFTTIMLSLCYACADFIEYPLEGKEVELLAPSDSLQTIDSIITFWWDRHEDAKFYRLQIVTPNFDSVARFEVDTLLTSDKGIFTLPLGKYTWRLRPENHGSVGNYRYRQLEVITNPNEK